LEGHYYSVPHALIGQALTDKLTADRVEIYNGTTLVARHVRSFERGMSTRDVTHFTKGHRTFMEHSLEEIHVWARKAGPAVYEFVRAQMRRDHRMVAKSTCDQIKALGDKHGTHALNKAAGEALALNTATVTELRRALNDQLEPFEAPTAPRNRYARRATSAAAARAKEVA
jgi:hypothetical protein